MKRGIDIQALSFTNKPDPRAYAAVSDGLGLAAGGARHPDQSAPPGSERDEPRPLRAGDSSTTM